MKKYISILITAAIFTSCSSNDSFKDVDAQGAPIAFSSTYIGKITKAYAGEMTASNTSGVSSGTLCTEGNTMEVWGWKYNGNQDPAYTQVFDNTVVTYRETTSQTTTHWEYSPLKFWDRFADYKFYAVAPSGKFTMVDENLTDDTKRKFQLTGVPDIQILQDNNGKASETQTVLATATASDGQQTSTAIDYLVASVVPCAAGANTQGNNTTDHDVDFSFNHILSKLIVNVLTSDKFPQSGNTYPYIELTKLYITIGGQATTYNQRTAGSVTASDTDGDQWSGTASSDRTLTCFYADNEKTSNKISNLILTSTNQQVASYFVAPSPTSDTQAEPAVTGSGSNVKVQVEYVVNYADNNSEKFLSNVLPVANLNRFDQNTVNNLNIKIEPQAIYFDVQTINNWTTGQTGTITVQ